MAYESGLIDVQTFNVAAATVLTAGRFVDIGTGGNAVVPSAGANAVGIVQSDSANNETRPVAVHIRNGATLKVEAGGTISVGANVATNASGQAVAASGNATVLGQAREAAVSGDVISIVTVA